MCDLRSSRGLDQQYYLVRALANQPTPYYASLTKDRNNTYSHLLLIQSSIIQFYTLFHTKINAKWEQNVHEMYTIHIWIECVVINLHFIVNVVILIFNLITCTKYY